MRILLLILSLVVLSSGCAFNQAYNPVTAASQQIFLLNQSSLKRVTIGMKTEQVHQIMGDSIIIGYSYQKQLSDETSILKSSSSDYRALKIPNPYKTERIKTAEGIYIVEYYVSSIHQPDEKITNDELVPLIFRDGIMVAKGQDYVKALRLKNPS